MLNATIFGIWGTVLLGDGGMVQTEHYKGFAVFEAIFGHKAWACAFLACAAFAALGMLCDASRCKVLGGYALLLGALTWALLAMGFVAAYPPVNTAMFVYAAISVMCFLSGEHVMYTVRQEDAANNKKQGGAACGVHGRIDRSEIFSGVFFVLFLVHGRIDRSEKHGASAGRHR